MAPSGSHHPNGRQQGPNTALRTMVIMALVFIFVLLLYIAVPSATNEVPTTPTAVEELSSSSSPRSPAHAPASKSDATTIQHGGTKPDDGTTPHHEEQNRPSSASSSSSSLLTAKETELERKVIEAVNECNRDRHNTVPPSEYSCILIRNARVFSDRILVQRIDNDAATEGEGAATTQRGIFKRYQKAGTFPVKRSRHHLSPIRLEFIEKEREGSTAAKEVINFGIYQPPVLGAKYHNVWHTISDFASMLFHTVGTVLHPTSNADDRPVWFTTPAQKAMGRGCASEKECRESTALFDPFTKFFHRIIFLFDSTSASSLTKYSKSEEPGSGSGGVLVRLLILGINTKCSPIPTEQVGAPECQANLKEMRDFLLRAYQIKSRRLVSKENLRCPTIHIMNRQSERYRKIFPDYDGMVQAIRQHFAEVHGCNNTQEAIRDVKLSGKVSFREQVESVSNVSILVAGRGGGTGLSIFLPENGGGYLSISGKDQWNPYRDLIPHWTTMRHVKVPICHPSDWRKPAERFYGDEDPNRASYVIKHPAVVISGLSELIAEMKKRLL